MFKEFVDEHNVKAIRKANQFVKAEKVEVKNFVAFADNLAKTHLIVEFEEPKEEAPTAKKTTTNKSTAKSTAKSTTTK